MGLNEIITKEEEDQREREEKTIKKKEKERGNMFVRAGKNEGSDKVGIFLNNKTSSNK